MEKQLPQIELISSTIQGSVSSFPSSEHLDSGVFVDATMTIVGMEVNTIDVGLLILCPVFAALGIMVSSLLKEKSQTGNSGLFKRFFSDIFANVANIFIGIVVGLVISLFFVGAINNDISSLARVLVLTVLLGYNTPLFWSSRKKITSIPTVKTVKTSVSLSPDALKQEKIKRARLKLAAKN